MPALQRWPRDTVSGGLRSLRVTTYSSFDQLPSSYLQLFESAANHWYDYSLPWFQNFVRTAMDEGDQLRIYGAERDGDQNAAVAALAMRYNAQTSGFFSSRQLSSLANFYTITFSPLVNSADADSNQGLIALAKAIATDANRWDSVDLRPLDRDEPIYACLLNSFKSAGMVVQPYFCFGNWYLPTVGLTFEEYFKTLPSATQNTIRRKTKKLEKTGKSRVEIVTGIENLEQAIASYEQIYISSWKRPEPYPEFVPGLIRTCAERNWLRMGVIYLDDQPIAAQVWIVNSGKATIYKLGHDQRFDEFSAGSILTTAMIRHVLDVDKVREIDFGSGDDPYKKNWLPQRRERWGILAMNPRTLLGCLGIVRNIGGRAAKNAWQAVRRRPTIASAAPPSVAAAQAKS